MALEAQQRTDCAARDARGRRADAGKTAEQRGCPLAAICDARALRFARRPVRRRVCRHCRLRPDQPRRLARVRERVIWHQGVSGHAPDDRGDGWQLRLPVGHRGRVLCRRAGVAGAQRADQRGHRCIPAARLDSAGREAHGTDRCHHRLPDRRQPRLRRLPAEPWLLPSRAGPLYWRHCAHHAALRAHWRARNLPAGDRQP